MDHNGIVDTGDAQKNAETAPKQSAETTQAAQTESEAEKGGEEKADIEAKSKDENTDGTKKDDDLVLEDDPKGVKKRINRAISREKTALEEANEWKAKAQRAEDELRKLREIPDEKKAELSAYEQGRLGAREENLEREINTAKSEAQRAEADEWNEKVSRIEDFADIVNPAVNDPSHPITHLNASLVQAIQESDFGPEITYELSKDRELAARLAKASPMSALKMIIQLEARAEGAKPQANAKSETAQKPKVEVQSTPKPGAQSASQTQRSLVDADMESYIEQANKRFGTQSRYKR